MYHVLDVTNTIPVMKTILHMSMVYNNSLVACCHGAAELHDTKPGQPLTQARQSKVEGYGEQVAYMQ